MSNNLTGQRIKNSYLTLVQIINGLLYDGGGNLITSVGFGTVTSVGISVPSWLMADGPITSAGTINITATPGLGPNLILATPDNVTGIVNLRTLTIRDLPTIPWDKLSGFPNSLSGYGITDPIVLTDGNYANPSWITTLAWNKITSTPTTLVGYGITDAVNTSQLGISNGVATLDSGGTLTASQIPATLLGATNYLGVWNANLNDPLILSHTGAQGDYYKVSVAGNVTIDGNTGWLVNDTIIFNGTSWDKIAGSSSDVVNVFGRTGAIISVYGDYSFSQISNTPTTLAGYGITDSILVSSGSYANPSWIPSFAWSKITGSPNSLAGYGITDDIVIASGSYANPSWITSLAWNKITSTPTTLIGYGITDAINVDKLGVNNGVATLDSSGKLLTSQIPPSLIGAVIYQGVWNASTNMNPTLVSGVGIRGYYYKVNVAGMTTIDGISNWAIGDFIIYSGSRWDKIAGATDGVISVFGRTGIVIAQTGDYSFSQLSGIPTTLSGYGITDPIVLTNGSYANPSWITSFAWSKITTTPSTLVGYGITDPIVLTNGSYGNPSWITTLAWNKLTGIPSIVNLVNGLSGTVPLTGTDGQISISASNVFSIDINYIGQNTITTLGIVTVGTWNATPISGSYINITTATTTSGTGLLRGNGSNISFDANTYLTSISGISAGGDLTGSYPNPTITNGAVTFSKMVNLSDANKLIGRYSSGTGIPQEINISTGLNLDGSGNLTAMASGTVTSVSSADANATFSESSPAPILTIVSAPKWQNARNLAGNSVDGTANVPFSNKFIVQGTTDTGLSNAQFLGSLGTGILKNTTATGILSIASDSDITGSLLTGYSLGSGTVVNTDSILQAIQKLAGNIALLSGAVIYQGLWNADTNTPTLVSGGGIGVVKGYYYKVSVEGDTEIDGISQWNVGDSIIFDGTTWDKLDGLASEVISVNGMIGIVPLTGAPNRITVSGANEFDISANYVGQDTITTLGTVTLGTMSAGVIIGRVTMTLASDQDYDMYYRAPGGLLTRLGNGTTGQILTATSGNVPSWAPPATNGTVTNVSVVSLNGFAGTVNLAGTTPQITLTTTVSGILKGNGTALSVASPGTDYEVPVTFSTGLTRTVNTVTVNTTQNIVKLSNLTTNGFIKTSTLDGTLIVDTNTYLTTISGISAGGDLTGSYPSPTIASNAVTYAKMQAVSTTSRLLGSSSTTTAVQEIQISTGLTLTGNTLTASGAGGTVTSVNGTLNRISVATGTTTPVIDIDTNYAGQNTITTLGTITTGLWHGTVIGEIYGGTNQSSYALGDTLYASATNTLSKLPGNITTTKKFLTQTGNGSISAAPGWNTLVAGDVPDISATYSIKAGNTSLTTVGTVTVGTWNANVIGAVYGGTGIANNAASTITISGNFGTTFTVSGTTSLILPVSGTLATTAVTTLSSLTSVSDLVTGSIGTGFVVKGVTMTLGGDQNFDIYYRNSGVLTRLGNGSTGQLLTATTSAAPSWISPATAGTVTSIATNNGITGGTITSTGTIGLAAIAANSVLANITGSSGVPSSALAYSATPAASILAAWDANINMSTNNLLEGYATIVTSAGTNTLTVASKYQQYLTGSTTHIIRLPDTSTLVLGHSFLIINASSGAVSVQTNTSTLIQTMIGASFATYMCVSTANNTAAAWNVCYSPILGTNVASMLSSFTSANIAAACTDETGSGALVFGTDPILTVVTPAVRSFGYLGIPQRSVSNNTTTVAGDSGGHIYHPAADITPRTWIIDSNANVPYPIGTALTFINEVGAGAITIQITTDTLVLMGAGTTGNRTLAAGGIATAVKVINNRWIISGTNLT